MPPASEYGPNARQPGRSRTWDVGLIYRQMGRKRLEGIESVGPRLADVVEDLIGEWT
jgi:hypothetical protein